MFKKGDRVFLNDVRNTHHGELGTIVAIDDTNAYPYQMKLDGDEYAFWYHERMLARERPSPKADESPCDFDRTGLGVGGLGRYVEGPPTPTIAQIEQAEAEGAQECCRRCGTWESQGAMFTTDPASGFCDDCYG